MKNQINIDLQLQQLCFARLQIVASHKKLQPIVARSFCCFPLSSFQQFKGHIKNIASTARSSAIATLLHPCCQHLLFLLSQDDCRAMERMFRIFLESAYSHFVDLPFRSSSPDQHSSAHVFNSTLNPKMDKFRRNLIFYKNIYLSTRGNVKSGAFPPSSTRILLWDVDSSIFLPFHSIKLMFHPI